MKRVALIFVVVTALAAGCSKQPEPKPPPNYYTMEKFNKVQNGMTMNEVEGIIGRWTVASPGDTSPQKYQWKRGNHEINVDFVDGKVVAKSNHGITE
jgi:nitrous oxide reductase accessory protein NosL